MGPRSRELLQSVSRTDFSNQAFPFGTSKEIDLGYATVRATRLTYVGELGWELYVPVEFAVGVHDTLHEAGKRFGLVNAGYYAIESLRIEKGFRAWSRELTTDIHPFEAGLSFACKLNTDIPFRGREALLKLRAAGVPRRCGAALPWSRWTAPARPCSGAARRSCAPPRTAPCARPAS